MISFSTVEVTFSLNNKRKIRSWVKTLIETEGKSPGDITYVFCNDNYLSEMNIKYLKHKTLTDIITFDYSNKVKLSGDIFISIERVKENAVLYKATFNSELGRVMAHGVLHLVGYGDHTSKEKATMRRKEDSYLSSFPNL
jgi:probable rRNA maturation factor